MDMAKFCITAMLGLLSPHLMAQEFVYEVQREVRQGNQWQPVGEPQTVEDKVSALRLVNRMNRTVGERGVYARKKAEPRTKLAFGEIYILYQSYDGHKAYIFDESGRYAVGGGGQTTNLNQGRAADLQVALAEMRQYAASMKSAPNWVYTWTLRDDGLIEVTDSRNKHLIKLNEDGTELQLYWEYEGKVQLMRGGTYKIYPQIGE